MAGAQAPFIRFHNLFLERSNGCWEWTGTLSGSGYGQIKVFKKMVSAHRFAYELYRGPIPEGAHILHSCDNKLCVNPSHLRAGTHAENMAEAGARGLMPSGDKHHNFGKRNPRPKQAKPVRVLGKPYPSQKEAERCLSLGSGTVAYWLKNAPDKAQILPKEQSC